MKYLILSIAMLCLIGCGQSPESDVVDVDPQDEVVDPLDLVDADSNTIVQSIEGRDRKKPDRHHKHDEVKPDQQPGDGESVVVPPVPADRHSDRTDKRAEREKARREKELEREKEQAKKQAEKEHNKLERAKRWGEFCGHFTGAANSWGGNGILSWILWPVSLAAAFLKFVAFVAYWLFILLLLALLAGAVGCVYLFYRFIHWVFTPKVSLA